MYGMHCSRRGSQCISARFSDAAVQYKCQVLLALHNLSHRYICNNLPRPRYLDRHADAPYGIAHL